MWLNSFTSQLEGSVTHHAYVSMSESVVCTPNDKGTQQNQLLIDKFFDCKEPMFE